MHSFITLLGFTWKNTFQKIEFLCTPLFLCLSLLVLLSLCIQKFLSPTVHHLVYIPMCYLISLIALAWFLMRVFASLEQDETHAHLRVLPVHAISLYAAHVIIAWSYGILSLMVIATLGWMLLQIQESLSFFLHLIACLTGFVIGICPIAIMSSILSISSKRDNLIFPIIFFPLTIPIAIASLLALEVHLWQRESLWNTPWWMVLAGMDLFFLVLCALLFREISD